MTEAVTRDDGYVSLPTSPTLEQFESKQRWLEEQIVSITSLPALEVYTPLPPLRSAVTSQDLGRFAKDNSSLERLIDEFDGGELRALKSKVIRLVSARARNLSEEDASQIESSLKTVSALDRLVTLLRRRGNEIGWLELRSKWEAYLERCETLSVDIRESIDLSHIPSILLDSLASSVQQAAVTLEKMIDASPQPLPDAFLDVQDRLEEQLKSLLKEVETLIQSLKMQSVDDALAARVREEEGMRAEVEREMRQAQDERLSSTFASFQLRVDLANSHLSALLDAIDAVGLAVEQEELNLTDDLLLDAALEVAKEAVNTVCAMSGTISDDVRVVGVVDRLAETLVEMEAMVLESKASRTTLSDQDINIDLVFALGTPRRPSASSRSRSSSGSSGIPRSSVFLPASVVPRSTRSISEVHPSPSTSLASSSSSSSTSLRTPSSSSERHIPRRIPSSQGDTRWISSATLSKERQKKRASSLSSPTNLPAVVNSVDSAPLVRRVDREVSRIVDELPMEIAITAADRTNDESGQYFIDGRLCFIRILRSSTAMVRVGGGWLELRSFLLLHFGSVTSISPSTSLTISTVDLSIRCLSRLSLSRSYSGELSARRRSSTTPTAPTPSVPTRWRV